MSIAESMKTNAIAWMATALAFATPSSAEIPKHLWGQTFGDASGEGGSSVAVDAAGNIYATGGFIGDIDLGGGLLSSAGSRDVFLVKYDSAGTHLWSARFGTATSESGAAIAVDAVGNIALIGTYTDSIDFGGGALPNINPAVNFTEDFLAKFDTDGTHLWSRGFDASVKDVTFDAVGNVAATGGFDGVIDFGGGPLDSGLGGDIFLVKYSGSGIHLWSQHFGEVNFSQSSLGNSIAVDANDNILITGWFDGVVDFGGVPLINQGYQDVFVAKYAADGAHVWSQRFGDAVHYSPLLVAAIDESGEDIVADTEGNVYVAGTFVGVVDFGGGPLTSANGTDDMFLAKYDENGSHLWSKRFGDYGWFGEAIRSLAIDSKGNVLFAGSMVGTIDFGGGEVISTRLPDEFWCLFAEDGGHLWSERRDGTLWDLDFNGVDEIVTIGAFSGTADFGGGEVTSAGDSDVFLNTHESRIYECSNVILVASGISGTSVGGQSFSETRGVDATIRSRCGDLQVQSLSLDGLNLLDTTTVGARIHASETGTLLASNDAVVSAGSGLTVTIPISMTLLAGETYRFSFFVEGGSATLFDPDPDPGGYPHIDASGRLVVNQAYSIIGDQFPSSQNIYAPQITIGLGVSSEVPAIAPMGLFLLITLLTGSALWASRTRVT